MKTISYIILYIIVCAAVASAQIDTLRRGIILIQCNYWIGEAGNDKHPEAEQEAGYYQMPFDAKSLSSGIYFYRITAGTFVKSQKMLLLR
jgi:TctA family transporter